MKLLSAEVDNIIRIKSGLEWEDAVGKSYDVWLSDLRYLAELEDKACGETEISFRTCAPCRLPNWKRAIKG